MTTRRGFLSRLLGAAGALLGLPPAPPALRVGKGFEYRAGPSARSWDPPIRHTISPDCRDVEIPGPYAVYWPETAPSPLPAPVPPP